jgi:hypothetical protein
MPPIYTAHDRAIAALRRQIDQVKVWIDVDRDDRRAKAFHLSKLQELEAELHKLQESDSA